MKIFAWAQLFPRQRFSREHKESSFCVETVVFRGVQTLKCVFRKRRSCLKTHGVLLFYFRACRHQLLKRRIALVKKVHVKYHGKQSQTLRFIN